MVEAMTREQLEQVREWAIERLTTGNEPPWSWYQLMKLREALEAILAGTAATQPMAGSQESAPRSGTCLRLVGGADRQDSAPRHQDSGPIPLPM
jgi:hypothetical protein